MYDDAGRFLETKSCDVCDGAIARRRLMKRMGVPLKWCGDNLPPLNEKQKQILSSYSIEKNVLITGPTGCGKSFLSAAIFKNYFIERSRFYSVPTMLMKLKDKFNDKDFVMSEFIKATAASPILVMDDFGANKASDWAIETIYCILNERDMNGIHGLIVTTNLSVDEIEKFYGQRISSRILDNVKLARLDGEDRRLLN